MKFETAAVFAYSLSLLILSSPLAAEQAATEKAKEEVASSEQTLEQMEADLMKMLGAMFQMGNQASKQAYGIDLQKEMNVDANGQPVAAPESKKSPNLSSDPDKAGAEFEQMLKGIFDGSMGTAGNAMGVLGKMAEQDIKRLNQGASIDSKQHAGNAKAQSLTGAATLKALMGDLEGSIPGFEAAIKADPNFPTPYYNLACAYARLHQVGKSASFLGKVIAMDPKYKDMANRDSDFDGVRNDPAIKKLLD